MATAGYCWCGLGFPLQPRCSDRSGFIRYSPRESRRMVGGENLEATRVTSGNWRRILINFAGLAAHGTLAGNSRNASRRDRWLMVASPFCCQYASPI